jgi:lipopolysaccharide transport system permease protein
MAELLVVLYFFGAFLKVDIPNFPASLFTGLLVYGWFQTSLNFATGAIVGSRELVKRPGVPVAALPVVSVASNLVHFLLSLPILVTLLIIDKVQFTGVVLCLPLLIVLEFVLILGLAYPVAAINVWFRDTQPVLRIDLQLLFYLTPVFYETKSVPRFLSWF